MEGDRYSNYRIWQPLLLGVVAVLGFWAGIKVKLLPPSPEQQTEIRKLEQNHIQKIQDVISYIQSKYVDSLNQQKLIQSALESYVNALDPYSEYIPADEFQTYQNALSGKQTGFGTELYFIDSNLVFFNTLKNSKAYQSGIRNGDEVLELNGLVVSKNRDRIYALLQQILDSKLDSVNLKAYHRQTNKVQNHIWKVDSYEEPAVKWVHLMDQDIVYLKIDQFIKGSYREFMEYMEEFVSEKKGKHLIIDVRGNSGGLVNEVAYILNQLIYEKEKLLFHTNGFHVKKKEYKSTGNAFFKVQNIAVLMDSNTASAAELFAMALKDLNRAKIIGDTSFGKSTILEQFNLADGSAIRLAIARFTTLSGKNIQAYHTQNNSVVPVSDADAAEESQAPAESAGSALFAPGVLPDVLYEDQNQILKDKDLVEYIDKRILEQILFYSRISQDHPDRIYESKEIKEQIQKEYKACPENLRKGIAAELFEQEFRYALCAWLFNSELEQRDRLRKDEIIQIAIRAIKGSF
ncbi:MAG: hypothetical protein IPM92_12400 [Saprospiraceae bacterium]|nr:hypothetical protein [Saprospiraceae bacterium]